MNEHSTHTIAALSTPVGRGALAVIRLTGDDAQSVFAGVIREVSRFKKEIARRISVYTVVDSDNPHINHGVNTDNHDIIDEVTAIKYDAPRSFTGEEMVEIFCHGGSAVTGKILDRLFRQGARPAGRGEFSRRAFVNGKIGLLKAESIAGLIESQTEMRLRSAQLAYSGRQLESLEKLKRGIIDALSDIESQIEFGEEGRPTSENGRVLELIIAELEEELRRGDRVRAFDDGVAVALAGPANAGKSSLFNEILGYDRSIVHDRPGTTRDVVSERILFEGTSVKLFDCAGIRETGDAVEQQGIERTLSAIRAAHLVLWVTAADERLSDGERQGIIDIVNKDNSEPAGAAAPVHPQRRPNNKILVVINKIDTAPPIEKKQFCEEHSLRYIETSLTERTNRDQLFDAISAAIHSVTDDIHTPEIIINERHRAIVVSIIDDLRECVDNLNQEEVSAHYLKSALGRLEEFCGHVTGDEVLDEVFGKFCIGK
jgi:tRNA modification GTPase